MRRAGRQAVREAEKVARAGRSLDVDEVAWLGVLLVNQVVLDYAIDRSGPEEWRVRLWTDVVRRAELADYARSGYDRGHMAPNGDMPDRDSQRDSFSLANIVPQDGENNRNLWAGIEGAVRKMAKREGDLYVVTGPAFLGSDLKKIGNVLVPTHLYKLVYSPRRRAGAAWFVENTPDAKANVIPIPELERIIGINLLPALSDADKERVLELPEIRDKPARRNKRH